MGTVMMMHTLLVHEAEYHDHQPLYGDHPPSALSHLVPDLPSTKAVDSQCDQTTSMSTGQIITEEIPYDQDQGGNHTTTCTQPFHYPNYTDDDEREDTYHRNNNNNSNNPRRYHRRRAYSNPPIPSRHPHRTQSRRRPSLSSTLNFTKDLKDLKYSPKAASLLKAASRALEAGAATALKLRKDSPSTPLFSAASGSKIAAAALGAAVVDGLMEHEHQRHPKLMRKGGLRHQMVKQVVQRGVAGLVGGMIEEGLTGGGGGDCGGDRGKEEEGKKGRRPGKKESVKRVVKGAVMDYEKWEKGKGGDDGGGNGSGKEEKGGRGRRGSERERERERERDTDGEGRRRERKRERERERGREGSVRSRRR
ncbi:hypothetical protein SMACR_03776 [Sordaria macrospora]|uniref:Uncharacterized protein n=1 Tax=Sordaria macrospora TaxID=5147 RepID=A0A8S8ZJ95_SORMA|nr:hypothetical protein SMACR_03776 [Sordaria macrospora]WPJ61585.1 hypothetical protein SMAC4_03776 [Sordaria macrospora]